MSKGKIDVTEHQWAQKIFKVMSWPFDRHDGDPTQAAIATHCKKANEACKKRLKKYVSQKKQLQSPARLDTFSTLHKSCNDYISRVDGFLKKKDHAEANGALDDVDAILDAMGQLFIEESGGARAPSTEGALIAGKQVALQERIDLLNHYKAQKKTLRTKEQKEQFDQIFKQGEACAREAVKRIKEKNLQGAGDMLFQLDSPLQGLNTLLTIAQNEKDKLAGAKATVQDAKARISKAYDLRKTLATAAEQKDFAEKHRQARDLIKVAEGLIKSVSFDEIDPALKSIAHAVEQVEYAVGTNTWAPLDDKYKQDLKKHKIEIQFYYNQINQIEDKAAKRPFEKHYQKAINLIADTQVLIEGEGRAAEEKVVSKIAALQAEIRQLEKYKIAEQNKPAGNVQSEPQTQPEQKTTGRNAAQNALSKALAGCKSALEEAQINLSEVLKTGVGIKHTEISDSFAQYASEAQAYIREGLQHIAERKLQEARGKLASCEDAINSMFSFLESKQNATETEQGAADGSHSEQQTSPSTDKTEVSSEDCRKQLDQLSARRADAVGQNPQFQQEFQQDEYLTYKVISGEFSSQIDALIASGNSVDAHSRLQDFERVILSLEECVRNAIPASSQPSGTEGASEEQQPDPLVTASLKTCRQQLDGLVGRFNKVIMRSPQFSDQNLQDEFMTYQLLWEQLSSQADHLISENELEDAQERLIELGNIIQNTEACAEKGTPSFEEPNRREEAAAPKTKAEYAQQYESLDASKSVFLRQQILITDPDLQTEFETIKVLFELAMPYAKERINDNELEGLAVVMASLEQHRDQLNAILDRARAMNAKALARRKQEQQVAKEARLDAAPAISLRDAEALSGRLSAMRKYVKDPNKLKIFDEQATFVRLAISQLREMAQSGQSGEVANILKTLGRAKAELQMLADENRKIQVPYTHQAPGIRNNVDARKKPSGENPQFFCEVQEGQFCLKHAINACLGFQATTKDDLLDASLVNYLKAYDSKTEEEFLRYASGVLGRDVRSLRKELQKDSKKLSREVATAEYEKLYNKDPLEDIRNKGSIVDVGLELLKAQQQKHGLPEPKITYIEHTKTPAEEGVARELLSHMVNSGGDRFVINIGGHYVAFRQVEEGDWYLVNSTSSTASKVDPVEYCLRQIKSSGTRLPVIHFEKQVNF